MRKTSCQTKAERFGRTQTSVGGLTTGLLDGHCEVKLNHCSTVAWIRKANYCSFRSDRWYKRVTKFRTSPYFALPRGRLLEHLHRAAKPLREQRWARITLFRQQPIS